MAEFETGMEFEPLNYRIIINMLILVFVNITIIFKYKNAFLPFMKGLNTIIYYYRIINRFYLDSFALKFKRWKRMWK